MVDIFVYSFASVICVAFLILFTKPLHIHLTAKGHNSSAPQRSHTVPTPRIGGLTLVIGYGVGMSFLSPDVFEMALILGVSTIPVFLGGLGEDTGFDVSPIRRLLLSFVSAAMAAVLFNTWITDTGLNALWFLTYGPVISLIFTIILSGGIAHAVNLIDGLNGLAMGVTMLIAGGLGGLAYSVGDTTILTLCGVVLASVAGLFVFNFPIGKIFLGDAGAYSMGHLLTWIGILLLSRNPQIAPFSVMLMFFWPVMDMLFAIARRLIRGRSVSQPDRLHFHQLVMRAIELVVLGQKNKTLANPLATLVVLPMAALPVIAAQFVYETDRMSVYAFLAFMALFILTFLVGIYCARRYAKVGKRRSLHQ